MKTKRCRTAAAASACAGLALLKMAFPGVAQELREKLQGALGGEPTYIEAFRDLGSRLSLSRMMEAETEPEGTNAAEQPTAKRAYLSYYLEEGTAEGEFTEPEPEAELPSAVTAFLERQAAFSDYALPENADYGYVPLPFDYCSPVAGYSSSGFGYRLHPILDTVRFHYGTDIAAGAGESIAAFADGKLYLLTPESLDAYDVAGKEPRPVASKPLPMQYRAVLCDEYGRVILIGNKRAQRMTLASLAPDGGEDP